MEIPTYKALYKPKLWGGLPRNTFILMLVLVALAVMVFKTPKAVLPIGILYGILVSITRYDPKYLSILEENLRNKDAYFPD